MQALINKVEDKLPEITKYKIALEKSKTDKAADAFRKSRLDIELIAAEKKACCTIS